MKKELKSRGLSIVGNKPELIARLNEALAENGGLGANNAEHNEDSALEDQLLGDESVADETISKTDDHLIEDLLNTNATKAVKSEASKGLAVGNKSPSKLTLTTKTNPTAPSSPTKSNVTSKPNDDSADKLKTITAVKVLSAEERKQLRAQKFGDNKLSERANRFGLKADSTNTTKDSVFVLNDLYISSIDFNIILKINIDEKLQKRAQRFGAIVSEKMKQMDDNQKLLKRKERFGANTTSDVKTSTTTTTDGTDTTSPNKRKIVFSDDTNKQKQKRLERFGKFL